jgi:hypothetical protein
MSAHNGRPKELRWADSDNEDTLDLIEADNGDDVDNLDGDDDLALGVPSTYLDAVRRLPPPDPSSSPDVLQAHPFTGGSTVARPGCRRPVHDRLGPHLGARSGRHRQRSRGQTRLIHGLPLRPAPRAAPRPARRIPDSRHCREASPPRVDTDGFTEVRGKRSSRRRRQRQEQHAHQPPAVTPAAAPRIPAVFSGKCFRCLSTKHLVATCTRPTWCFCYHGFRHLARDCTTIGEQRRGVRLRGRSPPTPTGREAEGRTPSPRSKRHCRREASPPTPNGSRARGPSPSPPSPALVRHRHARRGCFPERRVAGRGRTSTCASHPTSTPCC